MSQKKALHRCEGTDLDYLWICEELDGKLGYFEVCDDNTTFSFVNFCPICGYSIKEKE